MAAADGSNGFNPRAIESGSNSRSRPSNSTDRETFRACDYRESGHTALGGVRRQVADDFVVFSGRGAWMPVDLESSPIAALHHVEAVGVDIEDRKTASVSAKALRPAP